MAFHGRKVVAPLKQGQEGAGTIPPQPAFHGRKVVAPLKLGLAGEGVGVDPAFHGRKVVAPLKPRVARVGALLELPSTAARSWPH